MTTLAPVANFVKGAMYGLLIGDSLAMPTHWFYGGRMEVLATYGGEITNFIAPKEKKAGSIMSKSNTGGGGRGGYKGDIIGNIIFHDKKKYWKRGTSYHYHQGMKAGDNTLEALLYRRVATVLATSGCDKESLVNDYISFLTTKGTHNDTYCGTAHRMFFANRELGKSLDACPDNDGHNVDTADALVAAVPAMLYAKSDEEAMKDIATVISFTRKSPVAIEYGMALSKTIRCIIYRSVTNDEISKKKFFSRCLENLADEVGFDVKRADDDFDVTQLMRTVLLANANRGGENVATGALLGALLGAMTGFDRIPPEFLSGLAKSERSKIDAEIEAFLQASSFAALQRSPSSEL